MWRIASYLLNFYRISSTIAVKSGQLGGNADTFMPIFSAGKCSWFLSNR